MIVQALDDHSSRGPNHGSERKQGIPTRRRLLVSVFFVSSQPFNLLNNCLTILRALAYCQRLPRPPNFLKAANAAKRVPRFTFAVTSPRMPRLFPSHIFSHIFLYGGNEVAHTEMRRHGELVSPGDRGASSLHSHLGAGLAQCQSCGNGFLEGSFRPLAVGRRPKGQFRVARGPATSWWLLRCFWRRRESVPRWPCACFPAAGPSRQVAPMRQRYGQ